MSCGSEGFCLLRIEIRIESPTKPSFLFYWHRIIILGNRCFYILIDFSSFNGTLSSEK